MGLLSRLIEEPPFRLAGYYAVKCFANSVREIDRWGAVKRPQYFAGLLAGADQARREGAGEISAFEFGVAGGSGLLELQSYAATIERETGIKIRVFGFDSGQGLPTLCGDYRDHPDQWRPGDYRMDVDAIQRRLEPRTTLCLGPISETVPRLVGAGFPPTGFIACDVDLYSSTMSVLQILVLPGAPMLRRVPIYFDDIDFPFNHRFAGELLAVDEFNQSNSRVRIDVWRGVRKGRVFPTDPWLDRMFMAHNIAAINDTVLKRAASTGCALEA